MAVVQEKQVIRDNKEGVQSRYGQTVCLCGTKACGAGAACRGRAWKGGESLEDLPKSDGGSEYIFASLRV